MAGGADGEGLAASGGSLGLTVLAGGVAEARDVAVAAEAAGFDDVWAGEFLHRSAIVSVAAMAAATSRIGVGTSIAYAVGRSPLVLANDARGLDELSGGRLVLGLGTGTRGMMQHWHGVTEPDAPALRVEELVPLLRRLWRLHEGPISHDSRFFHVAVAPTADVPPPLRAEIPVGIAAVNPRMVEVAGFVGDRLLCHPTATPWYLAEVAEPALEAGLSRAERPRSAVGLQGVVITAIHEDVDQARREAAAQIAFYVAPKTYGPMMAAAGFGAAAEAVREAFAAKDTEGMVAAVPDEMVDAMALTGTPAGVGDRLDEFRARYDNTTLYSPSFLMTPERIAANTAAIIEAFGRT